MKRKSSMRITSLVLLGLFTLITSCAAESTSLAGVECRYLEVSGSRMREKFCTTADQWAIYDNQGQDVEDLKRRLESLSGTINTTRPE